MKKLFVKVLVSLLAASLLLGSAAMMEEAPEPIAAEAAAVEDVARDDAVAVATDEAAEAAEAPSDEAVPADDAIADAADADAASDAPDEEIAPEPVDAVVAEADSADLDEEGCAGLSVEGEPEASWTASEAMSATVDGEGNVTLTAEDFEDVHFWNYLYAKFNHGADDQKLTQDEINTVKTIDLYNEYDSTTQKRKDWGITSLKGLQYFPNLTVLTCSEVQLGELDIRENKALVELKCQKCGLQSLDVSNNTQLKKLFCQGNAIDNLDITNCASLAAIVADSNRTSSQDPQYGGTTIQFRTGDFGDWSSLIWLSYSSTTSLQIGQDIIQPRRIEINAVNFPDPNLRSLISEGYDNAVNGVRDGVLDEDEIARLESYFFLSESESGNYVRNLNGLELFTGLRSFQLSGFDFETLDLSIFPKLSFLWLDPMYSLTALDLSNNPELSSVDIQYCQRLKEIKLGNNPKLTTLKCIDTRVRTLDISNCSAQLRNSVNASGYSISDNKAVVTYTETIQGSSFERLVCDSNIWITGADAVDPPASIPIDQDHFEDENFRSYLAGKFDMDEDNALSPREINGISQIDLHRTDPTTYEYVKDPATGEPMGLGVRSLKGIEYFPTLTYLFCGDNPLTSLDVSGCPRLVDAVQNGEYREIDGLYSRFRKEGFPSCEVQYNIDVPLRAGDKTVPAKERARKKDDNEKSPDKTDTDNPAPDPAPAPASDPAPAPAPAAPASPTISAVSKASRTTIEAAPGTSAQLDLGGAAGKGFKSSNKKVATVDADGNVTFKKAGKVKITFKVGKKKRTVTLTVKDPTVPASVSLSAPSTEVKKGEQVTLTPVIPEGTNSGFKWKSSNKKVASVSADGTVTFKKPGKVTITATAKRGKKKAKIKFNVGK